MKVRDGLKRRAYSRHALIRTWDVGVRRDIRRQIREFEDRRRMASWGWHAPDWGSRTGKNYISYAV